MKKLLFILPLLMVSGLTAQVADTTFVATKNPIITHKYTADPAALVYDDRLYVYAGHDEAPTHENRYIMNEWLVFSTKDMITWTEHPVPLKPTDFSWASGSAWASQVVEKDGKFYFFATVEHKDVDGKRGKAVGVAVSDSPVGPFKDAIGSALITNDMTKETDISWDDIDPTIYFAEDGTPYLFWGNTILKYAKLKDNMIELDGDYKTIDLPHFVEAPYIHKREGWYYLTYAYQFPEKTAYAMSKSLDGPWEFKGLLNEVAGNSNTNHQAIEKFNDEWYFIYHNGSIPVHGGSFRRSVCIERLKYNEDGTLQRIWMTTEGIYGSPDK